MKKITAIAIAATLTICGVGITRISANSTTEKNPTETNYVIWEDSEGMMNLLVLGEEEPQTYWFDWFGFAGEERSRTLQMKEAASYSLGMSREEFEKNVNMSTFVSILDGDTVKILCDDDKTFTTEIPVVEWNK